MELTIILSDQLYQSTIAAQPLVEKYLRRGNQQDLSYKTPLQALFEPFGFEPSAQDDLPVAAVSALVDLEKSANKIWLRADPVFLHPDLTSLLLFDSQKFSLTTEDVMAIFSIINPFIEEDGLHLICGDEPSRWYLELDNNKARSITTTAPGIANGRDIRTFLPEGKDRNYWIRLGNEIQMLLHECSINQARKQRGEVPINSVWFWGIGELPEPKNICSKFDQIISNDVNAQGLAMYAGIPHDNIPLDVDHFLNIQEKDRRILIVLSQSDLALSEPEIQPETKQASILDSSLNYLKKGQIKQLKVITEKQHIMIKRQHLFRFWRKQ